ncbi:MAG TPA: PfkB family carbohydrate kinase [Longimicrobiales bacterium]|nr:PfkB family carbohydrate kinase [Longimicrobiales bacterium]
MSILVVGSVALDSVETPFGEAERVLGGSATFFSAAASLFAPVRVVGVIGDDYPVDRLDFLRARGVDLDGIEKAEGESFFWSGRYHYDLNSRDTLETRLGVFADFRPRIPEHFRDSPVVFLGNIDPELQLDVLRQVDSPRLVAADTMNFWIESKRAELLRVLEHVDVLLLNDSEVRELADTPSLLDAARWVMDRGPRYVVVKKGEHGAVLYARDWMFFAPGYPLERVFDPTGAGDAFAGGFLGALAAEGAHEGEAHEALRRAIIYGSATGSFAVEDFSVDRFRTLELGEVERRVAEFRKMTTFEHELTAATVEGA